MTKIREDGDYVVIESEDDLDEQHWYYRRGGSVYRETDRGDRQVCYRLSDYGDTLHIFSKEKLIDVIRREWRFFRYDMQKRMVGEMEMANLSQQNM